MSDIKNPVDATSTTSAPVDEIKNLKAEFNRKFENLNKNNEELKSLLQSALKPSTPESHKDSGDELETLMYTKPAEAVRRIKEEAKKEIRTEIDARDVETQKRNTVIQSLYKEYPELGIESSELYTLATKKYDEMAKEYGHSPAVYKAAVAEAAQETGTRPKSKRPVDNDDYSLSGSSSRSSRGSTRKNDELDPLIMEVAERMGADPARVKARANKRKNFGKWE